MLHNIYSLTYTAVVKVFWREKMKQRIKKEKRTKKIKHDKIQKSRNVICYIITMLYI